MSLKKHCTYCKNGAIPKGLHGLREILTDGTFFPDTRRACQITDTPFMKSSEFGYSRIRKGNLACVPSSLRNDLNCL